MQNQDQSQSLLYKTPLTAENIRCKITANEIFKEYSTFDEDINRDLEVLVQEYNLPQEEIIAKCGSWKETLLFWVSSTSNKDYFVELTPFSNYRARLFREYGKDINTTPLPCITTGITISNDKQIIAGVRGGKVHAGRICLAPCGYANAGEYFGYPYIDYTDLKRKLEYPDLYFEGDLFEENPIFRAYYQELYEELGLMKDDLVEEPVVIGEFYDYQYTKGLTYAFLAKAKFSAEDILKKQESAKDAWEFDCMSGIKADENEVKKFLDEKKERLLVLGKKPLELYLQYKTLKIEPRLIVKP